MTGVAGCPILRPDGTVAAAHGYDRLTGLYLHLNGVVYPPLLSVAEGVALLNDVLCDFPFEKPAHKTAAMSAIVTLVCRHAFPGCAPLHAVNANTAGTGKGLLTDLNTVISEGRRGPLLAAQGWRRVAEADHRGGNRRLAVHRLGQSQDQARRRSPGERADFRALGRSRPGRQPHGRHAPLPDLVRHGQQHRADRRHAAARRPHPLANRFGTTGYEAGLPPRRPPRLCPEESPAACDGGAVIPAGYIKAGRPDQHLSPWGSFEGWSALVRSALVWAGLPDCDTREELIDVADEDTEVLSQLLDAWAQLPAPMSVAAAVTLVETSAAATQLAPKLAALLDTFKGDKRHALGQLLKVNRDRVYGGRRLVRTDGKTPKWHVAIVKAGDAPQENLQSPKGEEPTPGQTT